MWEILENIFGIMSLSLNIFMDLINVMTCCDLSVFVYKFKVYFIDLFKVIGNFPEGPESEMVILHTQSVNL
jgi:hypothetical protein